MNNKIETLYYAVYSEIGFGIFTSKELLKETAYYTEDKFIQAFTDLRCAAVFAITGYNTFQYALNLNSVYTGTPMPLTTNHLYTIEDFCLITSYN